MDIRPYLDEDGRLHKLHKELIDALNNEVEGTEAYSHILDQLSKLTEIQRVNASVVFEHERDNKRPEWFEVVPWKFILDVGVKSLLFVAFVKSERGARGIMVPPKWVSFMIPKDIE